MEGTVHGRCSGWYTEMVPQMMSKLPCIGVRIRVTEWSIAAWEIEPSASPAWIAAGFMNCALGISRSSPAMTDVLCVAPQSDMT